MPRQEPKTSAATVAGLQARAIAVGLMAAGADAAAVFEAAGIPLHALGDGDPRFPRDKMLGLWRKAREATNDRILALHIAEQVPYGSFGILEYIARSSSTRISTRTLKRRLKDEGTTLTGLLDELRRELAVRYLDEDVLTLDAIAFELGFADARAFRRAFKRWTGGAPRDARGR